MGAGGDYLLPAGVLTQGYWQPGQRRCPASSSLSAVDLSH